MRTAKLATPSFATISKYVGKRAAPVFAVLFVAIGSSAFAQNTIIATVEAETFALPNEAETLNAPDASGGQAIRLNRNGTATGQVSLGSASNRLVVRAGGRQCKNAPQMVVKIDGVQVSVNSVTSNSWENYSITTNINAGVHALSVSFTNYRSIGRCSRALLVDNLTFYGPPAGQLMGWQLNETNTGLAPHGLSCASLPPYAGPAKPAAGTTITEKRIETYLDLSAGNIIVERSCIRPAAGTLLRGDTVVTTTDVNLCTPDGCPPPPNRVTIRDSEIDGSAFDNFTIAFSCAFGGIADLQRNYMHDTGSGICFTNSGDHLSALVENNYVTRLRAWGNAGEDGSHNESMTVRDFDPRAHPARRLVIQNNRFISKSGNDSAAFFIQPFAGYVDQVLIQNNLLDSFNVGLALEFLPNGYGNNMRSINNRFVPRTDGGGPTYVDRGSGWAEWYNNYFYDPSAPDGRGQLIPVPLP